MHELILKIRLHDERALMALVLRRRPLLDRVLRTLTHLASAAVAIPVAALLALGLAPPLQHAGRVALAGLVLSHLLVQLLKRTVTRPRPVLDVGIASLIEPPDRFSFPSGHAAAALAIALPLAGTLAPLLGFALLGLALVVGLSRCYLGVHYPGDVAVGWLLAALGWLLAGPALRLFGA